MPLFSMPYGTEFLRIASGGFPIDAACLCSLNHIISLVLGGNSNVRLYKEHPNGEMDGQADGQTDGLPDGITDRKMDGQTDCNLFLEILLFPNPHRNYYVQLYCLSRVILHL